MLASLSTFHSLTWVVWSNFFLPFTVFPGYSLLKIRHPDSFMASIPLHCLSALASLFNIAVYNWDCSPNPCLNLCVSQIVCLEHSSWNSSFAENMQKLLPKLMSIELTQHLCRMFMCWMIITIILKAPDCLVSWYNKDIFPKVSMSAFCYRGIVLTFTVFLFYFISTVYTRV